MSEVWKGGGDFDSLDQLALKLAHKGELKTCHNSCVPCSLDDTLQDQTRCFKS